MFGKIFKYLFSFIKKDEDTSQEITFEKKEISKDDYDKIRLLLEIRGKKRIILESPDTNSIGSKDSEEYKELEEYVERVKEEPVIFNKKLLSHIKNKHLSNSEVYNKAGIDRRHFSKIINSADYKPKKQTVIALCFALELNKEEMWLLINNQITKNRY